MRSIWYSLISFYSCISTPKHSPGIITRQFSNNQHDDAVILSLYVNAAIQVHLIIWDTFCVNAAIKVHLIIRDTFSVSYIFRIRWHTRWTSSIRKKQNNLNATSFWQVNSCSNVSYAFLLSILSIFLCFCHRYQGSRVSSDSFLVCCIWLLTTDHHLCQTLDSRSPGVLKALLQVIRVVFLTMD